MEKKKRGETIHTSFLDDSPFQLEVPKDNKTRFDYEGMYLRISKDECGKDRFTMKEIVEAIDNEEAVIKGYTSHCLCRKSDGKIFAEIISKD